MDSKNSCKSDTLIPESSHRSLMLTFIFDDDSIIYLN